MKARSKLSVVAVVIILFIILFMKNPNNQEDSFDLSTYIFDDSREYRLYANVICANNDAKDASRVTLVTQASLSFLTRLPEMAERWTGPISIAIFLVGHKEASIYKCVYISKQIQSCGISLGKL